MTEGWNILRRGERLGLSLCAVPSLIGMCVFLLNLFAEGRDHGKGLRKEFEDDRGV